MGGQGAFVEGFRRSNSPWMGIRSKWARCVNGLSCHLPSEGAYRRLTSSSQAECNCWLPRPHRRTLLGGSVAFTSHTAKASTRANPNEPGALVRKHPVDQ